MVPRGPSSAVDKRVTEEQLGEIGPGWEYYLDMLVAVRDGSPKPDFNDYYPAMKSYFTELATRT